MVEEFEQIDEGDIKIHEHNDSSVSKQSDFFKDVNKLLLSFDDVGNPFDDDNNDLNLETKAVVTDNLKSTLYKLETVGTEQYEDFIKIKIWERSSPLSDTISRNRLDLLPCQKKITSS